MFLAVEDEKGALHYGGTAFVVSVPAGGDRYALYLATARHNAVQAKRQPGRLVARYNAGEGAALLDLSRTQVIEAEHPGTDIAVFGRIDWKDVIEGGGVRHIAMDDMAATDQFMRENDIGIGTEVFATGLFAGRRGTSKNLPVGRTGTISAMPLELIKMSGLASHTVPTSSKCGLSAVSVAHRFM